MACQLIFLSGEQAGRIVLVDRFPFWMGRDPRCELPFDATRELTVSGRHAQIVRAEGRGLRLVDSSTNGTFINGKRVGEAILADGDLLELGTGGPKLRVLCLPDAGAKVQTPPEAPTGPAHPPTRMQLPAGALFPLTEDPLLQTQSVRRNEAAQTETVTSVTLVLERLPDLRRYTLSQQVIRIGRDPSADVAYDLSQDLLVSFNHAKIMALQGKAVFFDTESTNGTYLDGQRISRLDLCGGEELELGRGGPRLRVVSISWQEMPRRLTFRGRQVRGGDTVFAGAAARLQDLSLGEAALLTEVPLTDRMLIGRDPACAIALDSMFISSRHALVERTERRVRLRDLGSANGIYLRGERIQEAELIPGTEFSVGPYVLKFTGTEVRVFDTRTKTWVDAVELTRTDPRSGRNFLDHISLKILPGELVCILGPSGCGKSTLLKSLNGSVHADSGTVLMNNIDFYAHYEQLKHQVGYVPQDDIIHPQLTVWRTLCHAARLRLPAGTRRAKRNERIQDVLSVLELIDHRHKPVHTLSGGQRKRVSIAVELLTDPAIIYLDEPTSGLDPNLEEKMMLLFREMTLRGKTVAVVTHTLDHIQLADKVAFLVEGKLAFLGTADEGQTFFGVRRLPEVYKRFEERRGDLDNLCEEYRSSPVYERHIGSKLAHHLADKKNGAPEAVRPGSGRRIGPGALAQFWMLTVRYLEILTRDVRNTCILLAQAPLVALFIALAVRTDQPERGPTSTLFLIMSLSALWFGCSNAAREVTKEASIYARERMVNLGVIPYVASKFFVLQFLALIQVTTMLVVVSLVRAGYVLPDPPQACARWGIKACSLLILDGVPGSLWLHLANLYLTALNGIGLGLLVSSLAGNSDKAMSLVPLVLIPQVLFSGSFGVPQANEVVKRSLGYAMSLNWSLDQAKRIAMCTVEKERPPGRHGDGCTTCLHAHDPFKHRLLHTEEQDDDARCRSVLPVLGQMLDFPEALEVVEDGLYTPPSAHGRGPARQATRSYIGLCVLGGYSLLLFFLVYLFMRRKDRRR